MNIFEALLRHFQDIANAFEDEKLAATAFPHATEQGLSREDMLMSFLVSHLPQHCQAIKGGYVFDSSGNVSKQIDLMVTGDLSLGFKEAEKSFHCLEGCYSAICIRSELDRSACFDSLENLASVPLTPEIPAGLGFLYGKREGAQNLPMKVIFAFEGTSAEATLAHVEEFYAANQVPQRGRPNLIIVNNRYGIVRTGEQGAVTTDGVEIPAHAFHAFGSAANEPCIGGYSLMYLLTEIQRAVASASQSAIDFGEYLDQLPL